MDNLITSDIRNLIPVAESPLPAEELIERVDIHEYLNKTEELYHLNLISQKRALSEISRILQIEDPELKGIVWACLGGIHTFNGNYQEAFGAFLISLDEPTSRNAKAYIFTELSNLFRKLGYTKECISLLKSAQKITTMRKLKWRIKTYVGLSYQFRDPDRALTLLEECAGHYRATGETARLCTVLRHKGLTKLQVRDFKSAQDYFDQALALAVEQSLTTVQRDVMNDIGWMLIQQKNYDRARELFDNLTREELSPYEMSLALQNIGYMEYERGNYQEAIKFHSQSLQLSTRYEMRDMAFEDYYKLGLCHDKLGQIGLAAHFYAAGYRDLAKEVKMGLPILGYREKLLHSYVLFLTRNQKIPQMHLEEEIFGFAMGKSLKKIREIFHTSLLTLHLERTKNAPEMCKHLKIDTRTYFIYQKKLGLKRGKPRKGLFLDNPHFTQYIESLTPLSWKEANKEFEQDLFDFVMAKYKSNKTEIAKALDVSYAQVVIKTK